VNPRDIRFTFGHSSLGLTLTTSSSRGICSIALGDDLETLLRELRERLPHTYLIEDNNKQIAAAVAKLVDTPWRDFSLPLDMRGTDFQQRVWQTLQTIPSGATLSYAEIAARIGQPTAARAVGSACAANLLAVAIPCHRATRADGSLSGYRWGVDRKRALLKKETART
jgi:AraC family transcriptional regulator of adaptative response/methylated-DNA-[protein]-cysteine methyltransferase